MAEKRVEQKPSDTALFNALRRAILNKEYQNSQFGPDYLAEIFLPPYFRFFLRFKSIRTNTRAKLAAAFPGVTEYIIARTACFDNLFQAALNNQTPQIVLLGAGYDSRAYRFAKLIQNTHIFELDIAPTQDRKIECLKKAKITIPRQLAFVPIDFNRESLKDVLEPAGWQNHQRTLYICEGVTYYLDPGSVEATLDFFSQSADPEGLIAFDYTISITAENMADYYGAKEMFQSMMEQHPGEGLVFSVDEGKIETYLNERNLKMVEHLTTEDMESKFLTKDDGTLIGKVAGHFRIVLAGPKV